MKNILKVTRLYFDIFQKIREIEVVIFARCFDTSRFPRVFFKFAKLKGIRIDA